jgi:predicted HTH domain antitoxin
MRDWDRFAAMSREVSTAFRALPPEMNNTFLVRANEKLELIRESAEKHDSARLDREFHAFIDYVLSWIKSLGPKLLTREAMFAILMTILIATFQMGLSYKWRLDDKEAAEQNAELQNKKLDLVLKALLDKKKAQKPIVEKQYMMERTTPAFNRPRSRQSVGYVYAGQSVLAIATTGRWILVEYADRFSLERREGWIRKKYAKLAKTNTSVRMSEDETKLFLALTLYKEGKLSLGQAAQLAGFSKRDFIDVLGQHHIPVLNYSADELREEIGV